MNRRVCLVRLPLISKAPFVSSFSSNCCANAHKSGSDVKSVALASAIATVPTGVFSFARRQALEDYRHNLVFGAL
ncbi:hypothetical protein [Allocoleopsis sp.]|uniref:hypothetical protein n=1 Tax=Allocoleopsis sp. TaxID=3088169 RepID=UPI002FD761AD